MTGTEIEYDDKAIRFLEALWGKGYLSPGGPDEVRRIARDVDFAGKRVLDLGCGSGGIALFLAQNYPLAHITGYDVEGPVIAASQHRAREARQTERIAFLQGAPGHLPFDDGAFDIVFSKDSLIHVADKESQFAEVYRVLTPGGIFAASDWLTSHDGPPSPEMRAYLAAEGLSFGMASSKRYKAAMRVAGFVETRSESRNAWYRDHARGELERLQGPLYDQIAVQVGTAYVDKNIRTWQAMLTVLKTGEHCPTHLFARRLG